MVKIEPVVDRRGGSVAWTSMPGDTYLVIGKDRNGKKFRQVHRAWWMANAINLLNGRKYLVRNGKRYLLNTVRN